MVSLRGGLFSLGLGLAVLACGGSSLRVAPIRAEADAAMASHDLSAALEKYRRAWVIANMEDDSPGARDGLVARIQETQLAITRLQLDRLDALLAADPRAAMEGFLQEEVDARVPWWTGDSWYAFRSPKADEEHIAPPTHVLRTDRYSDAGYTEVFDRVKRGLLAAADVLVKRIHAAERVPLADADFLLRFPDGWAPPSFASERKDVAKRIAAQASDEKERYPSLAQFHQRVARHYDPTLTEFEPTKKIEDIAWHVQTVAGSCAPVADQFRSILEGRDGMALNAEVRVTRCEGTSAKRMATKADTERVAVVQRDRATTGMQWVEETETVFDTVVGQETYRCDSAGTVKFCVRSFSRQEPRKVTRLVQKPITETTSKTVYKDIVHQRQAEVTDTTFALTGTAVVTWPDGRVEVPFTFEEKESDGDARAKAISEAAKLIRAAGWDSVHASVNAISRNASVVGATDNDAALDLVLKAAFLRPQQVLDQEGLTLLAKTVELPELRVRILFAP